MGSVLQLWVEELPLRAQGTLLTGVRGRDLTPKPREGDTPERVLVAFLRWAFLNPADPREVDVPGAWFASAAKVAELNWKPSQLGHYPLHWVMHLMHSYEVVAYYHPHPAIAYTAEQIYRRLATSLHLEPERRDAMIERLTERRDATGTVVS
jgi:hypothetical protein